MVLNINIPNDLGARYRFWTYLSLYNLPEAQWIIGRDFNMTKNEED
jgi:hypothetical protein